MLIARACDRMFDSFALTTVSDTPSTILVNGKSTLPRVVQLPAWMWIGC
jgi:hypothetical protein